MNKLKFFGRTLYVLINLAIFTGAFMFTAETFMTDTSNVKEILFGGAMMLLLGRYFLGEIFDALKKNDALVSEGERQ